jgi:citrate lyase subunit beta/citryl-CoA lyase
MSHRVRLSPAGILFGEDRPAAILPAVDHYAGTEKTMRKALAMQADMAGEHGHALFDVTLDCEDGAPVGTETEHVHLCAELAASPANRFNRVGLRIHSSTHPHWSTDLDVALRIAGAKLAFITLPKARACADAAQQIAVLRETEKTLGIKRQLPVHVLIETHGALRDIWQIAALPGVESLDFGLMDFVSDHQGAIPDTAMQSPGQFRHPLIVRAKCEVAAAALAHGLTPTHNVSTELIDLGHIEEDARTARQDFGFLRMWSVHPAQIAPILVAMRPDVTGIELAAAILCQAEDAQWGPIRHEGKLHDRASYRYHWQVLCRARSTGATLPPEITRRFWDRN